MKESNIPRNPLTDFSSIIKVMTSSFYEIRVCLNCNLRYPLIDGNSFGLRCPQCLGDTRVVIKKLMNGEREERKIKKKDSSLTVMFDNIRSAWNVGSVLRSADGFGFNHAYLCGITPTPELSAVRKTALGAEEFITWSYHSDAVNLTHELKNAGWKIMALEENQKAITLTKGKKFISEKVALVIGNEITGVDPELLDIADNILYIPMRGHKHSFNVANAFSIAAYVLSG
jgi:23S rRNA (guanosine2251-2'-O)-methyltransferase